MPDMAFTDFLEDAILNHFFRNTSQSAVAPEVALYRTGTKRTVTFTNATNLVNDTAHPHSNGDTITFSNAGGALPTGITGATRYYVINANANDYQVSLTFGGSAVTFSDDGSGTNSSEIYLAEDGTGQTEASGGGYSRQSVTFAAPATSNDRRQVQNSAAVTFTASGGDLGGGEITTMAIVDASSNILAIAPLNQGPTTVSDGNTLRFNTNQITVQQG